MDFVGSSGCRWLGEVIGNKLEFKISGASGQEILRCGYKRSQRLFSRGEHILAATSQGGDGRNWVIKPRGWLGGELSVENMRVVFTYREEHQMIAQLGIELLLRRTGLVLRIRDVGSSSFPFVLGLAYFTWVCYTRLFES
jgi:hypothetical protein